MRRLFVYGTLRHAPLLEALLGRDVEAVPATLAGHRAACMDGRVYPGLIRDRRGSAVGSLVDVDDGDLDVLDRFEGGEYTRVAVTAATEDGDTEAETYLLTGPSQELVTAETWSLGDFVARAASAWVQRADPGTHHPTT